MDIDDYNEMVNTSVGMKGDFSNPSFYKSLKKIKLLS